MHRQSGFTLVEIAIVLVVVGLLLAGIIQGTALINSGTAKNLANELKTIPIYVYQYQDKYRALPGDDAGATSHVGGAPDTANGDGNGRITGAWNSSNGESFQFWRHIRLAQLAAGPASPTDAAYAPRNVSGGRVGVSSEVPIAGLTGSHFVCSGGVLGKYVRQIDTTLDDGNTDAGSVRVALVSNASSPQDSVASTAIDDAQSYNVCMGF